MARIQRKKPPRHRLFPDTNVLWHEFKDVPVAPDFSEFWETHSTTFDIDLCLPDVVFEELLYQHTSTALKVLERADKQFSTVASIAASKYQHRVKPDRVKRDVRAKMDRWVNEMHASILPTPTSSIDWQLLISNAVWRKPPFIEGKDRDSEKGFRDALILETFAASVIAEPKVNAVLITGDTVLRSAAKARLKKTLNASIYESLEEFSSVLRLLDQELTEEFVRSIQRKARRKFYSDDDQNSLLLRERLVTKIREQFEQEFEPPQLRAGIRGLAGLGGISSAKPGVWKAVTDESIWIKAPSFVEREDESTFVWKSSITFFQLFQYSGRSLPSTLLTSNPRDGQRNLRKMEYSVIWSSKVSKDGRFRSIEVRKFSLAERTFELPTDEDINRYDLDAEPSEDDG